MNNVTAKIVFIICAIALNCDALPQDGTSRPTGHSYKNAEFKFSLDLDKEWAIDSTPVKSDSGTRLFVATIIARGSEKHAANPAIYGEVEKVVNGEIDPIHYLSKEERGVETFPISAVIEEKTHSQVINGVKYATITIKLDLGDRQSWHKIYVLIRNGHVLRFDLRYSAQHDLEPLLRAFAKINYE